MKTLSLKLISYGLSALLFLTACERGNSRNRNFQKTEDSGLSNILRTALISEKPFLGLAQLLRPAEGTNILNLDDKSALGRAKMLHRLQQKNSHLKKIFLLRGLPYGNDTRLLQQTLAFDKYPQTFEKTSFFEEHDLSLRIQIQNQALTSIVSAFEKRSLDLARQLTPHILKELGLKSAQDVESIKKLTGIRSDKVELVVAILKKNEWIFSDYNFTADEKTKLIVLGMVAGFIVDELSRNKSVQQIIALAKDLSQKAQLLSEVCSLVQAIEMNKQQIKSDWETMTGSITAAYSQISELRNRTVQDSTKRPEIARFVKGVLTGQIRKTREGSFLSEKQEISKNLEAFVKGASSAANNLDNLLTAAEAITSKVGITLGKDLQNAISTARTVSSLVNVTNTVVNAYAGGGVIAALGVFGTGGSGLALLGGNPGQSTLATDLQEIKQDLKEIKMLQKQMIEMQMDTIKMIRDLALMSQAQHQEEMILLREIKGHAMVAEEAARMKIHSKIAACEQMIEFGLQNSRNYKTTPFQEASIRTHQISKNLLNGNLKTKENLSQFVQSWGSRNFDMCQQAFVEAFSFASAQESVLKLVVNPNDNNSAVAFFYRTKYSPLTKFVSDLQSTRSVNLLSTGLHLPTQRITEIQTKHSYALVNRQNFENLYDLNSLISADSLERYVKSLLLLAPIVAFDKEIWLDYLADDQALEKNYDLAWRRGRHWFESALALIQSAIAQETLLSGEVLVTELLPSLREALSTKEDCHQSGSLGCVIRANPVLRKNVLNYALYRIRKVSRIDDEYHKALGELNAAKMETLLGSEFAGHIVKNRNSASQEVLSVRWGDTHSSHWTDLPSLSELHEERITYSENMGRLLELQEKVADALVAMTPALLSTEEKAGLINLYF